MSLEDMNHPTDEQIYHGLVRDALERLHVRDEAQELYHEEIYGVTKPAEMLSFTQLLKRDLPEIQYAVDGVMGANHNVLLSAAFGSGKTRLLLNLVKALADGRPFLGRYGTNMVGNVCYMNYELDDVDVQRWITEHRIRRLSRCHIMNLRERDNPLMTASSRKRLVAQLIERDIEIIVFDTFRGCYTGDNQNDNSEVGRFTRMLDQLKGEAGISGLVLANHFGRKDHEEGLEHGMGATELDNWCDVRMILTRKEEDRFLMCEKRVPGFPESMLEWDEEDKSLRLPGSQLGVGRVKREGGKLGEQLMNIVRAHPGINTTELRAQASGRTATISRVLAQLIDSGSIIAEDGEKRGTVSHRVNTVPGPMDFGNI